MCNSLLSQVEKNMCIYISIGKNESQKVIVLNNRDYDFCHNRAALPSIQTHVVQPNTSKNVKRLKHDTFICFRSTCAKQLSKNNKRPASLARASSLCTFKTHKCYPIMQHMDCQYLLFQLYHFEHRQQKLKVCSLVHLHCLYLC